MNSGEIIKKAGLKVTPQRTMVYELMMELGHCPIDEIIARIWKQNPEVTVSTVYRILDTFCEVGLILKIINPNGKCYFDITPTEHPHVFINNEVIDYIDPELTEILQKRLKESDLFKDLDIGKISIQIIANKKN
jgi:Fe2+ or Zn2+ uptake regulation protein